jgi:hypothetical protein
LRNFQYWADRTEWDALADLQSSDPEFDRFLRSGSARVIVPVRPGMDAMVHHWLIYQEPFFGRPLPIPGEDQYVSVATEIRDLISPLTGGIPEDSWETKLGTTLLYLSS